MTTSTTSPFGRLLVAAALVVATLAIAAPTFAQQADRTRMEIYGFAMLDMGFQSGQNDPDWFDVLRPTKLPSFENEFGEDGEFFAGVRQSRLGFKTWSPTSKGEIKTIFEFELFGVGPDAGQTTFRLRHAWGEYGHWGAGQSWSPFMDPDVFPNSIEYWGPNGMVFFRNVQARWMPMQGKNEVYVALERPGASGDPGVLVGDPSLAGVTARFPLPDLSGHYKMNRNWGHLQVAGILRKMEWDDVDGIAPNFSGSATGWGVNLSSNLKFNKDVLKLQVVVGEGISNYMNDATADVGAVTNADIAEALPLVGVVAFYDRTWSEKWSSTIGWSMISIDNSDGQLPSAFHQGQYALVNLLFYPVPGMMFGPEVQYIHRANFSDGWDTGGFRLQVSGKYNFAASIGGK